MTKQRNEWVTIIPRRVSDHHLKAGVPYAKSCKCYGSTTQDASQEHVRMDQMQCQAVTLFEEGHGQRKYKISAGKQVQC